MSQPLIHISRKQAFTFAGFLVLYEFLTYIANDMIMPGMLFVVQAFSAKESYIATSLTAYVLGGASLQIFLGPLSDRFGRRPIMLMGAFFFLTCTFLIAASQSIEQFLWFRFFQGMGLCFISVIGYATLQEIFAEMDAIRLISILVNIATIAPLLGPLAGAICMIYIGWRSIFLIIGLLAGLALWGLWRYMPESVGVMKRDGSIIQVESLSFNSILRNYQRLFANASFILGSIALGLLSTPCMGWIAMSPVILVNSAQLSMTEYGLWQLPIFGACILGNIVLRRFTYHYSVLRIIVIGSSITFSGVLLAVILTYSIDATYFWLIPGLAVYGFGLGITAGPLSRYVLFSTEVSKGTASALMSLLCMGIEATGVECSSAVYVSHNNTYFSLFCLTAGALYILFFLSAYLLKPKHE